MISSPYRGPVEVSYLFIDGAYLRSIVESLGEECFGDSRVPIDYGVLANGFTKVFYYDCPPPMKSQESEGEYERRIAAYEAHCKKLKSLRGWHVVEGIVKRTGKRARQKEVDILIAVDMLTHTYRRNMHRVAFIAGDQDFRPLVEAVVREGMFIELWYEPTSASSELIFAADAHRPLEPFTFHGWLERHYRNAHPMPESCSQPDRDTECGILIAQATGELCAELYKTPHRYVLLQPDTFNDGYFVHMRHPDVEFLKRIHARTFGNVEWVDVV